MKFVYQRGDMLKISKDGVESVVVVESRDVGPTDPETEDVVITYTAQDGCTFTDDQIMELM